MTTYNVGVSSNTAEATSAPFAVCFSGGGSRSLSCTLGQLSALQTLPGPQSNGQSLMSSVSHISSVSGGSWASVLYTYLPNKFSDSDFLITPQPPEKLYKGKSSDKNPANVSYMNPNGLGTVPGGFDMPSLMKFMVSWALLSYKGMPWSWMWIAAVGNFVLKKFDLYDASGTTILQPTRFFSASEAYVQSSITPTNPSLTTNDFYVPRAGRPELIVNFNLMQDATKTPQAPVQALATTTGLSGQTPDGSVSGGGESCQSFGFSSTVSGGTAAVAQTEMVRRYSLCDITGCSSAFFAEFLQNMFHSSHDSIVSTIESDFEALEMKADDLLGIKAQFEEDGIVSVAPQYNYWSPSDVGKGNQNTSYGFSDGGTFDNTGLLGLLARTTGNVKVIAFVNTDTALSLDSSNNNLIVDNQVSLLFGYNSYSTKSGSYPSFGGMKPAQPMSYVQIFDDSAGDFSSLLASLRSSSCDGGSSLGVGVAWAQQRLKTVANPVAGIAAGRLVDVLWVYNNPVQNWQSKITDAAILKDLKANDAGLSCFPNVPTLHIWMDSEAVNLLSQLSAWNVQQLHPQILEMLSDKF